MARVLWGPEHTQKWNGWTQLEGGLSTKASRVLFRCTSEKDNLGALGWRERVHVPREHLTAWLVLLTTY